MQRTHTTTEPEPVEPEQRYCSTVTCLRPAAFHVEIPGTWGAYACEQDLADTVIVAHLSQRHAGYPVRLVSVEVLG